MGFCRQEVKPDKARLAFARKCWKHVERDAPSSAAFMKGMARGAHLSTDHIALLLLHEEIFHMREPHCTAFAATGKATRGGKTIVAMNWDWSTNLYPWAGLLRLSIKGDPRLLTYHFPGLWAGAGINEHGLAFMWTGSGYLPEIKPIVGMPTYVVIAEMLRRRNVEEVLAFLKSIRHAGSFIFFLGDASGKTVVIEGMPGRLSIERSDGAISRANHYTCDDMVRCSNQNLNTGNPMQTTLRRGPRMAAMMREYEGRISPTTAKKIMTDRHGKWPWIHAFPGGPDGVSLGGMTIDSLFAVCQDRVLWTCRGGREPGPWQSVTV